LRQERENARTSVCGGPSSRENSTRMSAT
jgi:hypothetical protein